MKLETPILTLSANGCDYYDDDANPWVCRQALAKWFEETPSKISLVGSTRPSKDAMEAQLNKLTWLVVFRVGTKGDGWLRACLAELALEFIDKGHDTIYVTLWNHDQE